jgi:D-arabinose 1-dehydrogenase-like Zn-dependent alcohol dehydrogenase
VRSPSIHGLWWVFLLSQIPVLIPLRSLTLRSLKVARGLSVHGWPSGHALDSEETIRFTELEDIKCMVQTYPLDRANEAFGKF